LGKLIPVGRTSGESGRHLQGMSTLKFNYGRISQTYRCYESMVLFYLSMVPYPLRFQCLKIYFGQLEMLLQKGEIK